MIRNAAFFALLALVPVVAGCARPDPRFATPRDTLATVAGAVRENDYKTFRESLAKVDGIRQQFSDIEFDSVVETWTGEYEIIREEEVLVGRKVMIVAKPKMYAGVDEVEAQKTFKLFFQKEGPDWKFLVKSTEILKKQAKLKGAPFSLPPFLLNVGLCSER